MFRFVMKQLGKFSLKSSFALDGSLSMSEGISVFLPKIHN